MMQPILRVKKGAPVYDDAAPSRTHPEVMAALRARRARAEHSQRRRRRGGRGLLLVLLAAVGLFLVWTMLSRSTPDRATVGGWQAILRATRSGDTLILGVTFIAQQGTTVSAARPQDVSIGFSVTGAATRPATAAALDKSPVTIREDIPFTDAMTVARAVVRMGSASVSLKTGVLATSARP